MSVAGAGAPDHHVVDGVVILLPDVDRVALLQLLVAQGVQLGEGHPQVGGLEQVLHLLAVRVEAGRVELDVWRQHPKLTNEGRVFRVLTNERRVLPVDYLSLSRGSQTGVAGLTDNFIQGPGNA